MSCNHPRPEDSLGLPCPWPGCADGTPKETLALMGGDTGSLRSMPGRRYEIEAEGGVTLWKRRQVGDQWEWICR